MIMDSPVVSRDVVAEYDEWHEQMGAGSGDPLRFPVRVGSLKNSEAA
jgi:hypothetical protein